MFENSDKYRRLIISDLHVGSAYSKEMDVLELLRSIEFDELILGGDIIDFIKVPQFTIASSELFNYLANIDKKVVYIIGNHDISFKKLADKKIKNYEFKNVYNFKSNNRKFRVVHGHQYDYSVLKWHYFMTLTSIFHDYIERIIKITRE